MSQYKTKMVNGVRVDLTPEEIAELEARDAAMASYVEPAPTKEELLAELQALTEKINALG